MVGIMDVLDTEHPGFNSSWMLPIQDIIILLSLIITGDIMDISNMIHILGDLLGQVLLENEPRALFDLEEEIRSAARRRRSADPELSREGERDLEAAIEQLDPAQARTIASAFVVYFDLVNVAEDTNRLSARCVRKPNAKIQTRPTTRSKRRWRS
jgi:phosphoenolpyruvate carboxylase